MAAVTSAAVAIPSFTGLKASAATTSKPMAVSVRNPSAAPRLTVKSSLKDFGMAVVAGVATVAIAGNAMAFEVLMGSKTGDLLFIPNDFTVAKGEKIVFKNNGGFPHNVVFDEDEVPSGVDASKISMDESELLNGADDVYSVTLTEPGTYSFYCSPHSGAGMKGKVTVN